MHTVVLQAALLAVLEEVLTGEGREAPLVAGDDLLATGELELGAAHGLVSLRGQHEYFPRGSSLQPERLAALPSLVH